MLCRSFRRYLCAFASLVLLQGHAGAVVLDWDAVSWADGSTNNSYQADINDPDSGITIDLVGNNGAGFTQSSAGSNPMTPAIVNTFGGGLSPVEKTLAVAVNLANTSQSITITISFANPGGATGVSFKLFDIDLSGASQDQVSLINALGVDGSTITPTITPGTSNIVIASPSGDTVVGTALSQDTGGLSGRGNVTFDFGASVIQSLTFTFGSTATGPADPAYQHFGIHDINFTPVPEANPAILSAFSCLAAVGFALRHRFKARK